MKAVGGINDSFVSLESNGTESQLLAQDTEISDEEKDQKWNFYELNQ